MGFAPRQRAVAIRGSIRPPIPQTAIQRGQITQRHHQLGALRYINHRFGLQRVKRPQKHTASASHPADCSNRLLK